MWKLLYNLPGLKKEQPRGTGMIQGNGIIGSFPPGLQWLLNAHLCRVSLSAFSRAWLPGESKRTPFLAAKGKKFDAREEMQL